MPIGKKRDSSEEFEAYKKMKSIKNPERNVSYSKISVNILVMVIINIIISIVCTVYFLLYINNIDT